MRKNILQLLIILFTFIYFQWAVANTERSGTPVTSDVSAKQLALDDIFETVFENESVYYPDVCQSNVIRLFEAFKKQLPNIEPGEFRVLYITTRKWIDERSMEVHFHVKQARGRVCPWTAWEIFWSKNF